MTDRLHLSERHRRRIEALLHEYLPGVEVWAYGSRVSGRSHDGSDLDLVLRGSELEQIPTGQLADFEEALRNSTIPFLVEARDWARLPERFHREIEREYVVLYDKKESIWRAPSCRHRTILHDITELTISSVDKKSKINEHCVKLCNYTDVYNNSSIRADMDFMKATATEHEIARCSLAAGDVIITKDSEKHDDIGVPSLVRDNIEGLVCGYHLAILRPRPSKVDGAYLYYALSTEEVQQQFHSYANGVTRFGLRKADIGLVNIFLPPLPEQRAIAHILGTLDDKVELNRRMNETLEAMARAIFKDWFVDFGPIRAKAEGRAPYLAPELWDLFPDALDGEGKPVGWNLGTLEDVAESPRRGISPTDVSENTPYIGLEHMPRRSIALSEWGSAGKVKSNKTRFHRGEILFGKLRPYFHKVGIAPLDGICSTDIVVAVPRAQEWSAFTLVSLSSDEFVDYTDLTSTGTKMPRTSWKTMAQYRVCLPPKHVVSAYQDVARPLLDRLGSNLHEKSVLAQTRDLLLPKLMSGEIRLRKAESVVEAVA